MYDDYEKERPKTAYNVWLKGVRNIEPYKSDDGEEVHKDLQDGVQCSGDYTKETWQYAEDVVVR